MYVIVWIHVFRTFIKVLIYVDRWNLLVVFLFIVTKGCHIEIFLFLFVTIMPYNLWQMLQKTRNKKKALKIDHRRRTHTRCTFGRLTDNVLRMTVWASHRSFGLARRMCVCPGVNARLNDNIMETVLLMEKIQKNVHWIQEQRFFRSWFSDHKTSVTVW